MTCATMIALDPDTIVSVGECGPFFLSIRWGAHRENGLTITPSQAEAVIGGLRRCLAQPAARVGLMLEDAT